ncbi:MAG: hypothetical protein AAFP88_00445 [Bacteroidota bacterium]
MKEVTLRVPDQRLEFFMELNRQLGFETVQEATIPAEHQMIVRERIKSANPEQMSTWQEARKQFTFNR